MAFEGSIDNELPKDMPESADWGSGTSIPLAMWKNDNRTSAHLNRTDHYSVDFEGDYNGVA